MFIAFKNLISVLMFRSEIVLNQMAITLLFLTS